MARKNLILNRYQPLGKAGVGGFSTVVAAFDTHLKRNVAIKVIDLDEETAQQLAWSMGLEDKPSTPPTNETEPERRALSPAAKAEAKRNVVLPWEEKPVETDALGNVIDSDNPTSYPDLDSLEDFSLDDPDLDGLAFDPAAETAYITFPETPAFAEFPEDPAFLDGKTRDFSREDLDNLPDATPSRLLTREDSTAPSTLPGLSEAQVAGNLGSPNIVAVYDLQLEGTTAYLIMEYVDGMSLADFLELHDEDMTLNIVAAIVDGVSNALEAAHRNNVLHLDIKPGNILIDQQGNVKVTDFGMAALPDAEGNRRGDGGTIGYMPPEQMDQEPLDERCDEWGLASVIYEMLAGENPFRTNSLATAKGAILNAELVLPSLMWEELDEQADDVLFYALDPDREERYETVADFAEEMVPLLGKPRLGRQELAELIAPEEEPEEEETEAPRQPRAPRIPLKDRLTPQTASIAGRTFAFIATALVMAMSMANMPQGNATAALIMWAVVAIGATASAFLPCVSPLFAYAALGAALIWNGHYIPAAVLILFTAAWWIFAAQPRNAKAGANIATGATLAGAVSLGPIAPLACGYYLTVGKAAMTAAFTFVVAIILASLGARDLIGWSPAEYALFSSSAISVTDVFLRLIIQPAVLIAGLAWILSAVACSLCCSAGKQWLAIVGAILGGAILMAGIAGFQFFMTSGLNPMPLPGQIASILISTAIVAGCASQVIPTVPEDTM